ncbi:MAG TPA: GntR family transcriptional regulator [Telmatospirillum sp.]|nr:GntR family transcriptional regulator [Telmatospirillum sp.]
MLPKLEIEHPKSLPAIVEERLRNAIINAELSFGQALPEDGTGLALGVSRTPMRQALTRLESQGLVVIVPKKGTFVFKPTLKDVEQLASFRLMLEINAIELSLASSPETTLRDMYHALAAMSAVRDEKGSHAYARGDTAFHESFFINCGNDYLINAFKTVSGRIAALRTHLSLPRSHEQLKSFGEHKAIVTAFEMGDKSEIATILTAHIMRAKTTYALAIEESAAAKTEI